MTKESLPELSYSNPDSVWFSSCLSTGACSLPEIRRINTETKSSTGYTNKLRRHSVAVLQLVTQELYIFAKY